METPLVSEQQLARALERHRTFWAGELDGPPLLWLTVPGARTGAPPRPPDREEARWTDVDYVLAAADDAISRTYYAGDALPVYHPWLGPNQFAAWLGAELSLKPEQGTSWTEPFVDDWARHPTFAIDPENRWWKLYLQLVRGSVEAGRARWVTAYPDLHTGIDARRERVDPRRVGRGAPGRCRDRGRALPGDRPGL